jgi:fucose 4-O-acetylase-like acetyltransferase
LSASEKIDKLSSERLAVLRFPLIVGVVFIHAFGSGDVSSTGNIGIERTSGCVLFVQNFISQGAARVAVPLFFLLSGYFFFLDFSWSLQCVKEKIASRTKSLVVPYLFWNIATLIAVASIQKFHWSHVYFPDKKYIVSSFGLYDYIDAVFGINRFPFSYQFWFIIDLIILMISSWIFFFFIRKAAYLFLVGLFSCWFFNLWTVSLPSGASVLFFYTGACIAYFNKNIFTFDGISFAAITIWIYILFIDIITKDNQYNLYIHRAGIIAGLISALCITKFIILFEKIKK